MKSFRQFIFLSAVALASVVGALTVESSDAHAICPAGTNTNITRSISAFRSGECNNLMTAKARTSLINLYDSSHPEGGQLYIVSWVSPKNYPDRDQTTVDAGSESVPLQLNTILYRGRTGTLTQGKQHLSNDGGTTEKLRNEKIGAFAFPPGVNQYKLLTPIDFDFELDPNIFRDQTYDVPVKYKGVLGTSDRSYHTCLMSQAEIDSGQMSRAVSNLDHTSPCSWLTNNLEIKINIRSVWTTQVYSQLYVREPGQPSYTARGSLKSGSDSARQTVTVPAGSQVYWRYTLRLDGASKGQNFTFRATNDRSTAGAGPVSGFNASDRAGFTRTIDTRVNTIANRSWNHSSGFGAFTVPGNSVGSLMCERVRWSPQRTNSSQPPSGSGTSRYNNCVQVRENHNLVPSISASGVLTPGTPAAGIIGSVNNGSTPNSQVTHAGVVRFVLPKGVAPPAASGTRSGIAPSTGFMCQIVVTSMPAGMSSCEPLRERSYGARSIGSVEVFNGSDALSGLDLDLGDRVCFMTAVNRYQPSVNETSWRYSAPACMVVAKVPAVQISGGDVIARGEGSEVRTSTYNRVDNTYGSWAEYSIFAASNVNSVSGAALPASGYGSLAESNGLTFANTTVQPGNFAGGSDLPFGGTFNINNGVWQGWGEHSLSASSININDLGSNQINYSTNDIVISGGSWQGVSGSYVIHAREGSDVRINENIRYADSSFSSLNGLPQLIIIADGDIIIGEGVDNVDAWLIAGGTVSTCKDAASPYFANLTSSECGGRLHINGPIQTGSIQLRRTAGADGPTPERRAEPAEVINLRSDAYLWAYGQAARSQTIRTDNVKELPPRF